MPPKAKDAKNGPFKPPTQLKDIVPPTIKQPAREGRPAKLVEYTPSNLTINLFNSYREKLNHDKIFPILL